MSKNRDTKGRFLSTTTVGAEHRFTSENQPPNAGRKPSRFKAILDTIEAQTGEPLSHEEYNRVIIQMLTLTPEELIKVAKDERTPTAIVAVASSIAGDIENQNIGNIETLLNRVFGKEAQKHEISGSGLNIIFENHGKDKSKKDD